MPEKANIILHRAPRLEEQERLRKIYLKAESDIIDAIAYKRSRGLVDYAEVAALDRVQKILQGLINDTWKYAPKMIEAYFYVHHPEARAFYEPVGKHLAGYENASVLTTTQSAIVDRLTMNLMGEITEAAATVKQSFESGAIGRLQADMYRRAALETVAAGEAKGANRTGKDLVERLRREGVTAFTDRSGRNWSLSAYANMATRTTARQAQVLSVLTQNEDHDLYRISSHGSTCPICAPLEGRIYSKSGNNPEYPSLSDAFGKVDKAGPRSLENSYLNIHPNCLHALLEYHPEGKSEAEVEKDKRFSSFKTNPPDVDPRNAAKIEAYRKKEDGRRQLLDAYRQYDRYKIALGPEMPKTVQTFLKHKAADDDIYRRWVELYKERT